MQRYSRTRSYGDITIATSDASAVDWMVAGFWVATGAFAVVTFVTLISAIKE